MTKGAKELDHKEAEELLARQLSEGQAEDSQENAEEKATKQLPPRWEIRIQAKHDPVVEETKAYRTLAREVDDRYDKVKVDKDAEEGQSR
jgi:hypothetical protein